jgi:recombination protein RecT
LIKIQEFQNQGELDLPVNYSAANALKSAWLILQNTVDKDKRPVLDVCTRPSVANALLDMVVQGLNPAKSQCYFIAYGRILTLSRSYLGNKAICLRVDPDLKDIFAEVVYEGDEVEFELIMGNRHITKHNQKLTNMVGTKIIAAYAIAVDKEGKAKRTDLMTMDELKAAWSQSKMKPVTEKGALKAGSVHQKFTAAMAKKTVTSRMAHQIIGQSDDATLDIANIERAALRTDDVAAQAQAQLEADEEGNKGDVIDIKQNPPKKDPPKPAAKATAKKPDEKKSAQDPEQEKEALESNAEPPPMTEQEKQEILAEEESQAGGQGKAPF